MSSGKCRKAREDLQDYYNQNYIGALLDDGVFDQYNTDRGGYTGFLHAEGCLDAPDFMPAGSMVYVCGNWYDRSVCERGVSLQQRLDREALMDTFLAELL